MVVMAGSQPRAPLAPGHQGQPHIGMSPLSAPGRGVTLAVALVGVVMVVTVTAMAHGLDDESNPLLAAVVRLWVCIPFLASGLEAWRRRPGSRLGPLIVGAGILTYLSLLTWARNDLVFTIGVAFDLVPPAVFLHIFLAYPDGVIVLRRERLLVVAGYATAALSVPALLFGRESPRNLIAAWPDPPLADAILYVQLVLMSLLMVAGFAAIMARRLSGGIPRQSVFAWAVDASALGLLLIALLLLSGLMGWSGLQDPIRAAAFFVIGAGPIVFLLGLLQLRLGRASVGELLLEIGAHPGPAELERAAARALHDPSATIVYRVGESASYVDVSGRRVALPADPGRSVTSIQRDGTDVAALIHAATLDENRALVDAVARGVGMAIENAQLQVELQAQLAEVQASRARIVSAGDAERRRLERDLHDGAQQRLIALSLDLRMLEKELADNPAAVAQLEDAQGEITRSLDELRNIARGLHPAVLSAHGLAVALEQVAARAPVPVSLTVDVGERLPEPVEVAAYYVVTESLANIGKHAHATAASVNILRSGEDIVVEVVDNGIGGADAEGGSGIRGLADRVEALGGRLRVWTPRGGGTRVRAEIPCA